MAVKSKLSRSRALVPVRSLDSRRNLEPGAYLVRVSKSGAVEIEQLPKGTLLIDGGQWERTHAALRNLSPMLAEFG